MLLERCASGSPLNLALAAGLSPGPLRHFSDPLRVLSDFSVHSFVDSVCRAT